MVVEVGARRESLAAMSTREGLFSRVCTHMFRQVANEPRFVWTELKCNINIVIDLTV